MHLSANGIRAGMLAICMVLATSVGSSVAAVATESKKDAPDITYLENIISVLRAHVVSMRAIIDHNDMKYADNMVRHARAFKRAIGMVGPMDWHAARAFEKAQQADAPIPLTRAQFEELAETSDRKVEAINRAANRYMSDKDGEHVNTAIDNMIQSCSACHSMMPEGTVPSVWADMNE